MIFVDLPSSAAWKHGNTRQGLETTSFAQRGDRWIVVGSTTAIEDGTTWWVSYELELSATFATTRATICARMGTGPSSGALIEGHDGRWSINGQATPELDGCLDVDLESSAMTNALPMRRLSLAIGEAASAPAVYVRTNLRVERLEQHYRRRNDSDTGPAFDYEAPAFQFSCRLDYDPSCLVINYPGITERIA